MGRLDILGYPLLVISALELFLGLLLIKQNRRGSLVNISVALFSLFSAAFALSAGVMYVRASLGLSYNLFARTTWIGWLIIPAAFQSVYYLQDERSKKAKLAGLILYPLWAGVLGLCLLTELVVTRAYRIYPNYTNVHGPLENPFRLIGAVLIFWFMYEVIRLRRQVTGVKRAQLNYFFSGALVFGAGASLTAGFLQVAGGMGFEPGLASYFSLPWVLFTFYAITRYRLFDIRIVISRIVNIVILSFFISTIQFVLYKVLEPTVGDVASIFISILLIGSIFFGTPLSRNMQRWINDLVLRDRFAYHHLLKESANAMITILHRDELIRYIAGSVRGGFDADVVSIYLREEDGTFLMQRFGMSTQEGLGRTMLPAAIVDRLKKVPLPLLFEELESSPDADIRAAGIAVADFGFELVVPLYSKGRLLGALCLDKRSNGDPYTQTDIDLLLTISGHASVAIENTRLFEEAVRIRASLRESEELFRTLADTTAASIFIHRAGKLLYTNATATRMTGYTNEELLQKNFWDIIHPAYQEMARERAQARIAGSPAPAQCEFKILTKEGHERWALLTASMIEFDRMPAIMGTMVDISNIKRTEEEQARLYEENVRQYQQRIADEERHQKEKESLLKDLHDGIGGLTTNINLLSELAKQNDDIAAVRKSLATISELSRESLSEIRGFIQSLDSKELSWKAIGAEFRTLGSAIIEPHGIVFSLDADIQEGIAEPGSMLTMNLFRIYKETLANVVKHARATSVSVAFSVGNGNVKLDVQDNGRGLKNPRKNGRGLLNMQARTEDLGGSFSVTQEHGTRITVSIPLPQKYPVGKVDFTHSDV